MEQFEYTNANSFQKSLDRFCPDLPLITGFHSVLAPYSKPSLFKHFISLEEHNKKFLGFINEREVLKKYAAAEYNYLYGMIAELHRKISDKDSPFESEMRYIYEKYSNMQLIFTS